MTGLRFSVVLVARLVEPIRTVKDEFWRRVESSVEVRTLSLTHSASINLRVCIHLSIQSSRRCKAESPPRLLSLSLLTLRTLLRLLLLLSAFWGCLASVVTESPPLPASHQPGPRQQRLLAPPHTARQAAPP